jgi:hypothetical protein
MEKLLDRLADAIQSKCMDVATAEKEEIKTVIVITTSSIVTFIAAVAITNALDGSKR